MSQSPVGPSFPEVTGHPSRAAALRTSKGTGGYTHWDVTRVSRVTYVPIFFDEKVPFTMMQLATGRLLR